MADVEAWRMMHRWLQLLVCCMDGGDGGKLSHCGVWALQVSDVVGQPQMCLERDKYVLTGTHM